MQNIFSIERSINIDMADPLHLKPGETIISELGCVAGDANLSHGLPGEANDISLILWFVIVAIGTTRRFPSFTLEETGRSNRNKAEAIEDSKRT